MMQSTIVLNGEGPPAFLARLPLSSTMDGLRSEAF
jgi:hypothetical protein